MSSFGLAEFQKKAFALLEEQGPARSLWPDKYSEPTGESAFKFLTECWWTEEETSGRNDLVPQEEYVEEFCHEWINSYNNRQAFLVEKSRRLLISWMCRGLETRELGIAKGNLIIVDQTYENAAEHLWRVHHGYSVLREKRPEFRLKPHRKLGAEDVHRIDDVVLPNGSLFTQGHQAAGAEQGKGKKIVVLEEISKYREPAAFWSQAKLLTMGPANDVGGWVVGIANASPNPDWQKIKGNVKARNLLGLE